MMAAQRIVALSQSAFASVSVSAVVFTAAA
jgi:hypothetical protein